MSCQAAVSYLIFSLISPVCTSPKPVLRQWSIALIVIAVIALEFAIVTVTVLSWNEGEFSCTQLKYMGLIAPTCVHPIVSSVRVILLSCIDLQGGERTCNK